MSANDRNSWSWNMRSPSAGRVEVPFSARFHFARSGRHPGGTPVEGLRMVQPEESSLTEPEFPHQPVMVAEIADLFRGLPGGVVLDATIGGGGHSRAILDAAPQLRIFGIDRDPSAVEAARRALHPYGDRARVTRGRFDHLADLLDGSGIGALSGALFDLGVSSPQLDVGDRGFSYRNPGPLDMRMDPDQPVSAADVINGWSERDLIRLLAENGEGRFARRIVRAIVDNRPLSTTEQLAEVVRQAIPAATRRTGGHPARRVFQAVRVAVNEELDMLPSAIDAALHRLVAGGRCAVLAYHSGEDRIVKDRFREAVTGGCVCPPGLPCVCGARPLGHLVHRGARRPGSAEVADNRRAQSARLRVFERAEGAE